MTSSRYFKQIVKNKNDFKNRTFDMQSLISPIYSFFYLKLIILIVT